MAPEPCLYLTHPGFPRSLLGVPEIVKPLVSPTAAGEQILYHLIRDRHAHVRPGRECETEQGACDGVVQERSSRAVSGELQVVR